jgi:hypothetical protein
MKLDNRLIIMKKSKFSDLLYRKSFLLSDNIAMKPYPFSEVFLIGI